MESNHQDVYDPLVNLVTSEVPTIYYDPSLFYFDPCYFTQDLLAPPFYRYPSYEYDAPASPFEFDAPASPFEYAIPASPFEFGLSPSPMTPSSTLFYDLPCSSSSISSASVPSTPYTEYSMYTPPQQEHQSQSDGGGKKRVTKSTRAKRNQVVCEHTQKKNNKQQKKKATDDQEPQFKCTAQDCGKVFKRAEHLKRHAKSIHDKIKGNKHDIHNNNNKH